jgi:hypothetical protein
VPRRVVRIAVALRQNLHLFPDDHGSTSRQWETVSQQCRRFCDAVIFA